MKTGLFTLLLAGASLAAAVTASQAVSQSETAGAAYELEDSDSLFGSYLAGRVARGQRETQKAADYYAQALDKDPENRAILEEAFHLKLATGRWQEAGTLGRLLDQQGNAGRYGHFFLGLDAFKRRDYQAAEEHLQQAASGPIAELTATLARAWTAQARGETEAALELIDGLGRTGSAQYIQSYHRALLADVAGQEAVARQAYEQAHAKNSRYVRVVEAYARHAARAGDAALAERLLQPHLAESTVHPVIQALADGMAAKGPIAPIVGNAAEGMAEVFYGIGEALATDGVTEDGQIFLQLALFLAPDLATAHYALGELYDQFKGYELAVAAYDAIPESSPLWLTARLRKAHDLNSLKRIEEAKILLKDVIDARPDDTLPLYTLGNLLRVNKDYAEAIPYYSRAIDKLDPLEQSHWIYFYARGVCYERSKEWPKAEADFRQALALDDKQELVLNYLGYSWVDQNVNLDEGLKLIQQAVQLKPNSGFIVDSLGWAYYRLKKYDEAVKYLDRAVELQPDDPILNDHLGDAYWRVGRRLEATFQWRHALNLNPEPEDEARIRNKLKVGLAEDNGPQTKAAAKAAGTPAPGQ